MRSIRFVAILTLFGACVTFSGNSETTGTESRAPMFSGDGGKGIVIAVPTPALENSTPANNWIPQFFQDLMTGDFVRFSAMTVLDRANESLILAEQELQANGNYSDEDYSSIGHLANAHYVVAGTIRSISGRYSVSFRINDIETNEIRASFNKQYSPQDVEGGLAAKEAVQELLAGMGVVLTSEGERQLLAIPKIEVRASSQLARGMAAEQRNDNPVEALAFFYQATTTNPNMREANQHIENFANAQPPGTIRERAEWAQAQKAKWEKIWADLNTYVENNLAIAVYDLSNVEDTIKVSGNNTTVSFSVTPGIKIFPNRNVLLVWKKVRDEWGKVRVLEENKSWASSVAMPKIGGTFHGISGEIVLYYDTEIGLYDDYGDRIASYKGETHLSYMYSPQFQVIAQHKYYDDARIIPVSFNNVPIEKITTDTVTPKIEKIYYREINYGGMGRKQIPLLLLSVPEWEQWLAEHGGR
ncbi:penicillin-binding protein activator LpoB [Treponema primitia]|uniref:hypothetical protein n=1 Tax=Treponema primitia TaxID=88058 RepID=UPI00397EF60B